MLLALAFAGTADAAKAEATPVPTDTLAWQDAFPTVGEPAAIHFTASYRAADGQAHRLEVWRSGSEFLHRRSDDRLDLYAMADAQVPGGYRYRLIDHRRRVMIDVARGNLMRIGVFAEWKGLAHTASPPRGGYRIEARPVDANVAVSTAGATAACMLRDLIPAGAPATAAMRICWSPSWGLPVRIDASDAHADGPADTMPQFELLTVEAMGGGVLPAAMPSLPAGYDYIDADADIDPSGD